MRAKVRDMKKGFGNTEAIKLSGLCVFAAGFQIFLRAANEIFVVFEGHHTISGINFRPCGFADFFFLTMYFLSDSLSKEINHLFLDVWFREVFHTLTETFLNVDIQTGFFFYFALCGLKFIFAQLHMAFRERPMAAKAVFEEQQLRSVAMFTIDQSATGFFMLQVSRSFGRCVHPKMPGRVTVSADGKRFDSPAEAAAPDIYT